MTLAFIKLGFYWYSIHSAPSPFYHDQHPTELLCQDYTPNVTFTGQKTRETTNARNKLNCMNTI